MKKIELMIIGAQKAGTTSLKNYLNQHPMVLGHPQLEFEYFVSNKSSDKEFSKKFNVFFKDTKSNYQKRVVAKSATLYSDERAIKRLHQHNPDCKLVLLLREPVNRAFSSYSMENSYSWLKRDFNDLIEILKNQRHDDVMYKLFIELGLYSNHLKAIYKYFPKESVRIYLFEDFKTQPEKICSDIFECLNIDSTFVPDVSKKHNQSKQIRSKIYSKILYKFRRSDNPIKWAAKFILPYRLFASIGIALTELNKSHSTFKPMDEKTKTVLGNYFKPYNDELTKLTGIKLDSWNSSLK